MIFWVTAGVSSTVPNTSPPPDHCADLGTGNKIPKLFPVQLGDVNSPGYPVSCRLIDLSERTFNSVKDPFDQARSQLCHQRLPCQIDRLTGADTCSILVYLDGCPIPPQFNDFTDQTLIADPYHIEHVDILHPGRHNQRAGDLIYGSCNFLLCLYRHL